ncbi:MAG: bifunctional UDP-sugar hydrolase/5'-nucleotidase, partial [Gemmatimonadota bacterium]
MNGLQHLCALLAGVLALACVSTAGERVPAASRSAGGHPPAHGPDSLRLTILGTTDVHGRIVPTDFATGEPSDDGLARVATLVDSIRAADPYTLLLDSGDLLQGSPFTTYFARVDTVFSAAGGVHPVIAAMNALGYDASAIGNHEFNYGLSFLRRALSGARFPFLAANVVHAGTDRVVHEPFTVKEVGPLRVGVIGFTTPGVMVWDRAKVEGRVELHDILEAADRWLPRLLEEDPDLVVATMHSGLGPGSTYAGSLGVPMEDAARPLAERHPEIDVILFGHTHRDTPQARVGNVLLAQAEKWGRKLAVAHVTFRRGPEGRWELVSKESTTLPTAGVAPSPRILELAAPAAAAVRAFVREPLARSAGAWSAATGRLEDTPIADLIQRVQLDATGADLSS